MDKETKWTVLQEYLRKYSHFINKTTPFTGLYVYVVDMEFYDNIGLGALDQQLKIVIGVVYLNEAVHSAEKKPFE